MFVFREGLLTFGHQQHAAQDRHVFDEMGQLTLEVCSVHVPEGGEYERNRDQKPRDHERCTASLEASQQGSKVMDAKLLCPQWAV